MKFFTKITAAILSILIIVGCSQQKPMLTLNSERVPQGLSLAKVEKAITSAGILKGWKMTPIAPGVIQADLALRTHTAQVKITYNTNSYAINYVNSTDLDYNASKAVIHRQYNNWITALNAQIQSDLMRSTP
jgi:hypothetical protein